jgi:nucleotide-binding universal stress UspA family protein
VLDLFEGPPVEVLLAAADDADVIVLGRHLRNHVAQIWHGALSVDVCRHAASPVVIVPS